MKIPNEPNHRRVFIDDFLKHKGLYVPESKATPPPELLVIQAALKVWDNVNKGTARTLLKALKEPSQYDTIGTQKLLLNAFQMEFGKWSKDDLCFLVSVMHTEELEKECRQLAEQGVVGGHLK